MAQTDIERMYEELTALTGITRKRDYRLEKIANDRAYEMRLEVGITGDMMPTHPVNQLKARTWPLQGVNKGVWENIAWFYGVEDVVGRIIQNWWNSPDHHDNLMRTDATTWGIGLRVEAVAGAPRYYAVTEFTKDLLMTVYLATGQDYPDALSAGPAAVRNGAELLLTPTNYLTSVTATRLQELNPTEIVLVGALTDNVAAKVKALLPGATVRRATGINRYDTAVLMSKE